MNPSKDQQAQTEVSPGNQKPKGSEKQKGNGQDAGVIRTKESEEGVIENENVPAVETTPGPKPTTHNA